MGDWIEAAILVLGRIGGCLMVAAGYASARVPMPIRLFLAIAVSLSVLQLIEPQLRNLVRGGAPAVIAKLALGELAIGIGIGLTTRVFLLALEFTAEVVGQSIGLANSPRPGIESDQALSPLAEILSLTALMVVFGSSLHLEAIRSLIESYDVLKPGLPPDPEKLLQELLSVLTAAFRVALQIAAPFILFGIVVNLLLGLATRMLPQLPMQFVGGPMLLVGGVALLAILTAPGMARFAVELEKALLR